MRCDVSEFEGKVRPDYTFQQHTRHEEQGWANRPHEDLVGAFRGLIWKERQESLKDWRDAVSFTPAILIKNELGKQASLHMSPDPLDKQRAAFFQPIEDAWDVIAYEYYRVGRFGEPNHVERHHAGWTLSGRYQRAVALGEPRPELLTLDPQQVKILDALAEAADIPHQQGQAEIEIPERFRYYAHHRFGPDGKLIF
jgi:hypothetical protein